MTERSDAVYIISVAAEIVGMHPQTLRVYERKGLVEPYRTPGGTRRYSDADLERLRLIQELSNAGVNIEGIKRILQLRADNRRLRGQVDRLRRLLEDAERRRGATTGTMLIEMGRTSKRQLPAIRRDLDN
ncbi:MAG: helix-turn-helix transcriptional regulator [Acidimicrobiia bacterium]|nr:helix-turn-helix transcriptional regulator [Acidimicrobiia bacterium]